MKNMVFMLIVLLSLVFTGNASAASGPDGFAEVPWGVTRDQVAQSMTSQGFSAVGCRMSEASYSQYECYNGSLVGFPGDFHFKFLKGAFYEGSFAFDSIDLGSAERDAYNRVFSIISSKYGPPTKADKRRNIEGVWSTWNGLQASGSSEIIQLALGYTADTRDCGGSPCASLFQVTY